jgi:hypothetical protein
LWRAGAGCSRAQVEVVANRVPARNARPAPRSRSGCTRRRTTAAPLLRGVGVAARKTRRAACRYGLTHIDYGAVDSQYSCAIHWAWLRMWELLASELHAALNVGQLPGSLSLVRSYTTVYYKAHTIGRFRSLHGKLGIPVCILGFTQGSGFVEVEVSHECDLPCYWLLAHPQTPPCIIGYGVSQPILALREREREREVNLLTPNYKAGF